MTGVRQIRASVRMFGRVPRIGPFPSPVPTSCGTCRIYAQVRTVGTGLAQRLQDQLTDRLERIEHSVSADGHAFHIGGPAHPLAAGLLHEVLAGVRGVRGDLLLCSVLDRPPRVSDAWRSLMGAAFGRSRLLYWMTKGILVK